MSGAVRKHKKIVACKVYIIERYGDFMDFITVARLRKYLSVKHHISGRIRIAFDKSIITDPEALALVKSAPKKPDAVKKTSLNIFSKSIVIEYDEKRCRLSCWRT